MLHYFPLFKNDLHFTSLLEVHMSGGHVHFPAIGFAEKISPTWSVVVIFGPIFSPIAYFFLVVNLFGRIDINWQYQYLSFGVGCPHHPGSRFLLGTAWVSNRDNRGISATQRPWKTDGCTSQSHICWRKDENLRRGRTNSGFTCCDMKRDGKSDWNLRFARWFARCDL